MYVLLCDAVINRKHMFVFMFVCTVCVPKYVSILEYMYVYVSMYVYI